MSPTSAAHGRITALAADRAVHKAFSWLHLHETQLRRWQTEFVRIAAPPFGEGERAVWFLARFEELGLTRCHIDTVGNVLGELLPAASVSADAPILLLSAHLDTVFPRETDCTPYAEGTRLYGPGVCDNGAGLTALLALAAALQTASLTTPCTVLFAANVGEEGDGDLRGIRHLFSASPFAPRLRSVIALEGAGTGTVVDRALGSRRLRLSVTGPGGHSWVDSNLPNPILALASALLELAAIPLPENPRTTLNCGTLQGGTSVNSIPELAVAHLDLRSVSGPELDRLERTVFDRVPRALERYSLQKSASGASHPLELRIERIGNRPAGALEPGSALLASLAAVDRHLGIATEFRIGSTDANLPLSLGLPALAIGAGGAGGGIHTLREWYDPTGRTLALRRLLLLLLDAAALTAAETPV